jgi:hypothetical protein
VLLGDLWPRRWWIAGGLLVTAVILWQLDRRRSRWWPLVTHPTARRLGPPLLAAAVALAFGYSYLVRPGLLVAGLSQPGLLEGYIGAPVAPGVEGTMVRVGWYLSPLGMLLAGLGLTAITARLSQRMLLWLGLAAIFGLAFNLASFTHEGYIYSLRRFVPIILPTLSIGIAYAVVVVLPGLAAHLLPAARARWLGPVAGGTALAALVAFFGYTGRTIIAHVEHDGARAQVATIAARFAPTDLILFAGPRDEPHKLATPLRFFHGLDALVVSTNNPRGDLIEAWLTEQMRTGRRVRVVLGDNGGKLLLPNYRLEPAGTLTLTMTELERLAEQKPFNVQTNRLEYTLYDLSPASGAPLPGPPFRYATGAGDELATVIGWYGREIDPDGVAFRWTNGDALLRLPWPPNRRPLRLRLHLAGGVRPPALGPAQVELALARGQNDRAAPHLATLTLSEGFATYEVTVPPDLLPDSPTGTVMLWLRNRGWQPSEHGLSYDPRLLGIRLAWLELTE